MAFSEDKVNTFSTVKAPSHSYCRQWATCPLGEHCPSGRQHYK